MALCSVNFPYQVSFQHSQHHAVTFLQFPSMLCKGILSFCFESPTFLFHTVSFHTLDSCHPSLNFFQVFYILIEMRGSEQYIKFMVKVCCRFTPSPYMNCFLHHFTFKLNLIYCLGAELSHL